MEPSSEVTPRRWCVVFLAAATVLLLASAVPIYLQLRELYLGREAYARYQLDEIREDTIAFAGHRVAWTGAVINVDGRRYRLRQAQYSSVALVKLHDIAERDTRLALIGHAGGTSKNTWTYDVLFISRTGEVVSERFTFGERSERLYRTMLARFVSSEGIGFESQILQHWPTVGYPVLYPWSSAVVGTVLLIAAIVVMRVEHRGRRA